MLPLRLFLVAVVILIHDCKLSSANKYDNYIDDHQEPRIQPPPGAVPGQEFKRYVANDPNYHYHEYKPVNKYADVPPPSAATRMARYVVHNTAWGALATISQQPRIKTFPFVNTFSVSDGPLNNGSGIPYLYMTPLDMSAQDLNSYDSRLENDMVFTNWSGKVQQMRQKNAQYKSTGTNDSTTREPSTSWTGYSTQGPTHYQDGTLATTAARPLVLTSPYSPNYTLPRSHPHIPLYFSQHLFPWLTQPQSLP
uniref:CREG-like beta-barrel domain-containing protein n=1 Tax=Timema tahoe TaxID=61484 RepID=A0A7R9FHP2_9NEOP|nr:unnamed protein product [Timema tahoe]